MTQATSTLTRAGIAETIVERAGISKFTLYQDCFNSKMRAVISYCVGHASMTLDFPKGSSRSDVLGSPRSALFANYCRLLFRKPEARCRSLNRQNHKIQRR